MNKPLNDLTTPVDQLQRNKIDRAEDFSSASAPATVPAHLTADKDYFVGVAISGGGSRSANFAAASLFELQRIGLLKQVDCISAVSGGSLAAAYYCSAPDSKWNTQAVQHGLSRSFARNLLIDVLLPWNMLTVLTTDYDRSDLLAQDFQEELFNFRGKPATFENLRADRPRLLINATDLQSGKPFVFSNTSFDHLNASLGEYPLAWAVTASSAVPVALHPVTLRDFSTIFPRYTHLVDGGVYDNLGVQTLVKSYESQIQQSPDFAPRGGLIIVIDAGIPYDAKLSTLSDVGLYHSALAGLGLSSTTLINRAERATLSDLILMHSAATRSADELRADISAFNKNHVVQAWDKRQKPVWIVHVALAELADFDDLPSQGFVGSINSIGTDFNIQPEDVNNLYTAASVLFRQRFDEKLLDICGQLHGSASSR